MMTQSLTGYPALNSFFRAQTTVFPEHEPKLVRRFANSGNEELAFLDRLAQMIARIVGPNVTTYCEDYRFLTDIVLEEEIFFRRENRYRLSTFREAEEQVYGDKVLMTRYMNGLLMSQLWWSNHTAALQFFCARFLDRNPPGFRHLEIGPGHGLLLYLAASHPNCGPATAWDISESSLHAVRSTLSGLDYSRPLSLELTNLFAAPKGEFDSIVFSEVLEHLEDPVAAIAAIKALLAPNGRAFVHAPVNSPAPDHLTLFRTPEEIVELVKASGLSVEDVLFAPTAGTSLQRARQLSLAISTIVIATRNPD